MFAIFFRIEVEPEQEATPFVEDTVIESRQQGKQPPPFDHVNKNPFPSQSRLCMNRMITLSILPHSQTHILCMAYHLVTVVSKPHS